MFKKLKNLISISKNKLSDGLKNGNITFDKKSHAINPIEDEDIDNSLRSDFYRQYCFNCGEYLKLYLDKNVLTFKNDCIAKPWLKARKLETIINFPSGEVIFQNFFKEKKLFCNPAIEYDINSLAGRKNLMDYLATQNVGYGQMGNMSVGIYSNMKDEILIADYECEEYLSNYEEYLEYLENEEEYSKLYTIKAIEDIKNSINDKDIFDEFYHYVKEKDIIYLGSISLEVWRWMCADKSILDMEQETLGIYEDRVEFKVESGDWKIEDYFQFRHKKTVIFSKLTKI